MARLHFDCSNAPPTNADRRCLPAGSSRRKLSAPRSREVEANDCLKVSNLKMKIKKLMPMDAESRRLIDWMEKGVYDALQKKYLRTLMFCVCQTVEGPMIEEYSFSFSYSNTDSQEVSMNVNQIGNKKQGETFKCNSTTEITPNQMKSSACKMVRTLIQLMRTLDKMPEERTILMKLLWYDDVTPADYEPPFFRGCTEEEAHNPWNKNPLFHGGWQCEQQTFCIISEG
ncbi:hypothetical protein L2E82_34140 [Cichorium intybus]|uniref:Uncharacterized protein n=1 Tax=Cichorium intybus TaxID=13427 RepID=A0ACB9BLM5_CICIN|nr:hypothetical protein L2E82_34140 [Cichorium intybus]